jgi:hypothetical protein
LNLSPPDTKAGRTQRVVLDLLRQHEADGALPTAGRFVFYELEQQGLAVKPDPDDQRRNRRRSHGWPPGQQDITDALTTLREREVIPWDWITDEERHLTSWRYAATVAEYLEESIDRARIDCWEGKLPAAHHHRVESNGQRSRTRRRGGVPLPHHGPLRTVRRPPA